MGDFFPFFMFVPDSAKRTAPQSFSVLSIITGSETVVTVRPDREDRRIADYRKSPLSRLLILND